LDGFGGVFGDFVCQVGFGRIWEDSRGFGMIWEDSG